MSVFSHRVGAATVLGWAALVTGCWVVTGCWAQTGAVARAAAPRAAAAGDVSGGTHRALAAQYLVIANAGNRRLEHDFDPLEGRDRDNLAVARADLRDAAATERLFDRGLLRIRFPSATERVAQHLFRLNQARAKLTAAVAGQSTSLPTLHAYERILDEANVPVEQAVRTIRRQLGLPSPDTS